MLHVGMCIVIANAIVTIDTVCLDVRKCNISRSAALITLCPFFWNLTRSNICFYLLQCHIEVVEFLFPYLTESWRVFGG